MHLLFLSLIKERSMPPLNWMIKEIVMYSHQHKP